MHNAWLRSLLCWKHPWVHFPLPHRLVKVKVNSLSRVQLFATPWTVAYQAPLSMGFSRQEYWSGLPFPSPGDLPNPGIEPRSPVIVGRHFIVWATREANSTDITDLNSVLRGGNSIVESGTVYHRRVVNPQSDSLQPNPDSAICQTLGKSSEFTSFHSLIYKVEMIELTSQESCRN